MADPAEAPVLGAPHSEIPFDVVIGQLDTPALQEGPQSSQPEAIAEPGNPHYAYQTEDGRVRTAETIEQAMKVCPVLGAMSVERAQRLLKLHARGQEKLVEQSEQAAQTTKPDGTAAEKVKVTTKEPAEVQKEPLSTVKTEAELLRPATTEGAKEPIPPAVPLAIHQTDAPSKPRPTVSNRVTVPDTTLRHAEPMQEDPAARLRLTAPELIIAPAVSETIPDNPVRNVTPTQTTRPARPAAAKTVTHRADPSESSILASADKKDMADWSAPISQATEETALSDGTEAVTDTPAAMIYEDFIAALFDMADESASPHPSKTQSRYKPIVSPLPAPAETTETPQVSLVSEVAERLSALVATEREAVRPLVVEMAQKVLEIQTLSASAPQSEQMTAAVQELAAVVASLLEAIGLESDKGKTEQLMQSLLKPEFMQLLANQKAETIEGIGTHEIKRYLRELLSTLTSLWPQYTTHQLLGTMAISVYH